MGGQLGYVGCALIVLCPQVGSGLLNGELCSPGVGSQSWNG